MAKRYTDTELWSEDWFCEMDSGEMLFWFYIKDRCDHAGFWRVNTSYFKKLTGEKIDLDKFFRKINLGKERVKKVSDDKWYIVGFIRFQYGGRLLTTSNVHRSILNLLSENGIEWLDKGCSTLGQPFDKNSDSYDKNDITNGLSTNKHLTPKEPQHEGLGKDYPTPKDKDKDKDNKEEKGGVGEKEEKGWQIDFDYFNSQITYPVAFRCSEFGIIWDKWMNYLSKRGEKNYPQWKENEMIKKLHSFSRGNLKTATEIVNESIKREYKGFFEPVIFQEGTFTTLDPDDCIKKLKEELGE